MNQVMIKTWDIDYEFLVKNYLDPKLWNKEWTIFAYKNFVFTLLMTSIDVVNNKITFRVKLSHPSIKGAWYIDDTKKEETFYYFIDNETIHNLKNSLKGCMKTLIESYEKVLIQTSDQYEIIENHRYDEQEKLTKIAKDFLDDNNVTNEEIREVYIDNFVDKNETIYDQLSQYLSENKYMFCTELYLIYAEAYKLEDLKHYIINITKPRQEKIIDELLEEVNEYVDYMETVSWEVEKAEMLEEI